MKCVNLILHWHFLNVTTFDSLHDQHIRSPKRIRERIRFRFKYRFMLWMWSLSQIISIVSAEKQDQRSPMIDHYCILFVSLLYCKQDCNLLLRIVTKKRLWTGWALLLSIKHLISYVRRALKWGEFENAFRVSVASIFYC